MNIVWAEHHIISDVHIFGMIYFMELNIKCGECLKSTRVCVLTGVNSETWEQCNPYIQSIKYTATHLSQSHFMFFTQFLYIYRTVRKP